MFVDDEAELDVSFDEALACLAILREDGLLARASADAHAMGAPVSSAPELARSRLRDLVVQPGYAVFALRWETVGLFNGVFPVLDADLTLTPAGPRAVLLQLTGVYRIRSGDAGRRAATLAIGVFLTRIGDEITRHSTGPRPAMDSGEPTRAGRCAR
jgi:hypothetical protein